MFWWIVLFAIRGILVFERFASRGVILGIGVMAEKLPVIIDNIRHGRPYVSYIVVADIVRAVWRRTAEPQK